MSRPRFALAALLYASLIAYGSTIIGGPRTDHDPIDHAEALRRFMHMNYVGHGSDQRSDWMGNLVMLVPFGFLIAGCFAPRRVEPARYESGQSGSGQSLSSFVAIGSFILCLTFILAVKYAQLFFPPRTVTLNYVVAQSLGAIVGIALCGAMRSPLAELGKSLNRLESLRIILRIYTGILIVFMLMPLDFALSVDDIAMQLEKLPDSFTDFSGEGRPLVVRIAILVGGMIGTAPIGALLTLMKRGRVYVGRPVSAAAWIGFFAMLGVYVATTMLLSGSASLPAVISRTAGIALGAWFTHWLTRQDPDHIRYELADLVPWAVPFYLVALFAVNGLLSFDWIEPRTAANDFYNLGLLPLFNYYIVTKAQAAKNIVGHAVMYAPIGVMIWLRARDSGGRGAAFVLAAILSAIVEIGRFLRPGLVPDINAVPLAGIAAWSAAALMPVLWDMLSAVAIGRTLAVSLPLARDAHAAPIVNWRDREQDRRTRRREKDTPTGAAVGDIEHY